MRTLSIVLIIILFLFSCKSDQFQYEYVVFHDGSIRFWRDQIGYEYKDKIENGDFLIDSEEGDTLKAGKIRNGFKVGKWKYCPSKTQTIYVDWSQYSSDDKLIEINYPQEWKVIESNSTLFQATFPSKSSIKEDKYFLVLEHNKKDLGIDLQKYWELLNKETHSSDTVESHMLRMFSREDGNFYLSTYSISRNNKKLFLLNFLGETETSIYDITYSSLKEDMNEDYVIFLEIVQSLKIREKRFFTPFEQSTKITNLEWPLKPEIIS